MTRPVFAAEFTSIRPWANDNQNIRQLRGLLKDLLRRFGWKCLSCEIIETETENPGGQANVTTGADTPE